MDVPLVPEKYLLDKRISIRMIPSYFHFTAMANTTEQVDFETGIDNSYLQAGCHFIGQKGVRMLRGYWGWLTQERGGSHKRLRPKKGYQQGTICICQLVYIYLCLSLLNGVVFVFFCVFLVFHSCYWQKLANDHWCKHHHWIKPWIT